MKIVKKKNSGWISTLKLMINQIKRMSGQNGGDIIFEGKTLINCKVLLHFLCIWNANWYWLKANFMVLDFQFVQNARARAHTHMHVCHNSFKLTTNMGRKKCRKNNCHFNKIITRIKIMIISFGSYNLWEKFYNAIHIQALSFCLSFISNFTFVLRSVLSSLACFCISPFLIFLLVVHCHFCVSRIQFSKYNFRKAIMSEAFLHVGVCRSETWRAEWEWKKNQSQIS